jgi:hypothetical protein
MSKATSTQTMLDTQSYSIARVFNPESFSVEWDLFLPTSHGIVQLSRFDGILDYDRGGLGEGEFYEWNFELHNEPTTPGDGTGNGVVYLEQDYGAKLQYNPEKIAKKLDSQWFVPVLRKDDKDVLAELDDLELPPCSLRKSDRAVLESKVAEDRLVLDSVYGPLSLDYYDGLVSHITGEMLPVSVNPYISDDYEVLVDVESDTPGLVETYTPQELLYLLETRQFSCYIEPDKVSGSRLHLLADGGEFPEPAGENPW